MEKENLFKGKNNLTKLITRSTYSRLTSVDDDGNACIFELDNNSLYRNLSLKQDKAITNVIERLTELEDKIEYGTLIELPCNVGDVVYIINNDKIIETEVTNCLVTMFSYNIVIYLKNTNEEYYLFDFEFNKNWFLTKAEAEAKLKEQQNER